MIKQNQPLMQPLNNIWDRLYNALAEIENKSIRIDCIIVHPYCYRIGILPEKYKKLGYPLGKSRRGWKKWFKKEEKKLQYLNVDIK